jgi:hypothetical protein
MEGVPEEKDMLRKWRIGILDTFRNIYKNVFKDIELVQTQVGHYILTNSDTDPGTVVGYGSWTLDKTDGDGVRFWRRTA